MTTLQGQEHSSRTDGVQQAYRVDAVSDAGGGQTCPSSRVAPASVGW